MRKFLISYVDPQGAGRFFHTRQDDSLPSEENVLSMEAKLGERANGRVQVIITGIHEIAVTAPAVLPA